MNSPVAIAALAIASVVVSQALITKDLNSYPVLTTKFLTPLTVAIVVDTTQSLSLAIVVQLKIKQKALFVAATAF